MLNAHNQLYRKQDPITLSFTEEFFKGLKTGVAR
jgi:hypothetical protein